MNISFEVGSSLPDRDQKITEIVKVWIDLVNGSDISKDTKLKIRILIEQAATLLGQGNTGMEWDRVAEKLQTVSSVSQMLKKPEAYELKALIDELNLDMSRKHRELLEQ